jgi:GT2 family glycosyltransferase/glycosyltransferase involved in cell wall biosynthesis
MLPSPDLLPVHYPALPTLPSDSSYPSRARKLRICIASFDFVGPVRNGGVGTAFTSLGEALAAGGHEVTFLYLSGNHCETKEPLAHWIEDYRRKGIRFVPMPDQNGPRLETMWHMGKSYEAFQWLKTQTFDVIHFSEWRAPGYYALAAKHQGLEFANTLLCVHTHGPTLWSLLSNGEYLTQMAELELDFMERESVKLADVVAAPSQYLLRWMLEQGWTLPERTYVQQYVRPATARPVAIDRDLSPRAVKEIVFFGRLEVRKGLVLFCDALDRLKADPALSQIKITFLGKLTEVHKRKGEEFIRERAESWPWAMQILSDLDQPRALDYLQGEGRIAVIPSMVDNLPNTVLECLGARVPFLASTTGGIPEMVATEDAEILFPLRAPAFAEKMKSAVTNGLRPSRFAVEPQANQQAWLDWHAHEVMPLASIAAAAKTPLTTPRVSVCISHFNRPDFLRQAIESIEAQTYKNFEVVLIDDASTKPEAIAYLNALAPKFAQRGWQLIRNQEELFVGAARNVAARHAKGDYLKFMDDDNVAKPHELATFVKVAQKTQADIVSCSLDFFSTPTAPRLNQVPDRRFLFLGAAIAGGALRNYFGDTNALFRREVFLKLGGFHEQRNVGNEDWKLIGDAVLKGYRLETIADALVWYRRTDTGESATTRNSWQAGHMANIQPYLDAVPRELRNLVLFAQGVIAAHGQSTANEAMAAKYNELTILWKSKLKAGMVLAELNQPAAAAKQMIEGIKSIEACKQPRVLMEALIEIPAQLMKLDPGRSRFLLEMAVKLAKQLRRDRECEIATTLIAKIDAARPGSPIAKIQ